MADIEGKPYWTVEFDADGQLVNSPSALEQALPGSGVTDLIMFCHGWNNSSSDADSLYQSVFGLLPQVLSTVPLRDGTSLGLVGVYWPSMLFPDSAPPGAAAGPQDGSALTAALTPTFPHAQAALTELGGLLDSKPADPASLQQASTLMASLLTAPEPSAEDAGEQDLLNADPMAVFGHLATLASPTASTDTQGLPNPFHRLWDGAKEALRAVSYYEMKRRAGHVGATGLGPLIARLSTAQPGLRVHLMGHSFGARLVSYSLTGLPTPGPGTASPVKSLLLVQGAFSHFSFAPKLPQDPTRAGGLAGAEQHVDGPLLATFTNYDLAVGRLYPAASLISGTDSEGLNDALYRWGAIGHDGYQAVPTTTLTLSAVGSPYNFTSTRFTNLDSNAIIKNGGPPSGAHSDITHPEIIYALLTAANVLQSAGPPDQGPT